MINARHRGVVSYLIKPLCAVIVLGGVFGTVWLRSNILSMEYEIGELEAGKMERLRETKTIMADIAALQSIQKVERSSIANLGLVFPDRRKVIYVRDIKTGPHKAAAGIKFPEARGY